jgi:hypothetical protein
MFKLMVLGLAVIGLIGCRDAFPENKEEVQMTDIRDNHTLTEYTEIIRDNHTSVTVTNNTTTTTTEVNNTSSSISAATSEDVLNNVSNNSDSSIAMFDDSTANVTAVNWTLGAMPTLTFYANGSNQYVMNQSGVTPSADNFSTTSTGFFTYTIIKDEMTLDKANVNPDNTSDITLVYKTDLYGYLLSGTNVTEMSPIEFTILVK